MRVNRLVQQLEQIDPNSPVYVIICGHRIEIYGIEAQVGYTEILLIDEHQTDCNLPERPQS